MKSPTSLIRFRNAVGVMLALSAIFAVVLSTISMPGDRALGQATTTEPDPVEVRAEAWWNSLSNVQKVNALRGYEADHDAATAGRQLGDPTRTNIDPDVNYDEEGNVVTTGGTAGVAFSPVETAQRMFDELDDADKEAVTFLVDGDSGNTGGDIYAVGEHMDDITNAIRGFQSVEVWWDYIDCAEARRSVGEDNGAITIDAFDDPHTAATETVPEPSAVCEVVDDPANAGTNIVRVIAYGSLSADAKTLVDKVGQAILGLDAPGSANSANIPRAKAWWDSLPAPANKGEALYGRAADGPATQAGTTPADVSQSWIAQYAKYDDLANPSSVMYMANPDAEAFSLDAASQARVTRVRELINDRWQYIYHMGGMNDMNLDEVIYWWDSIGNTQKRIAVGAGNAPEVTPTVGGYSMDWDDMDEDVDTDTTGHQSGQARILEVGQAILGTAKPVPQVAAWWGTLDNGQRVNVVYGSPLLTEDADTDPETPETPVAHENDRKMFQVQYASLTGAVIYADLNPATIALLVRHNVAVSDTEAPGFDFDGSGGDIETTVDVDHDSDATTPDVAENVLIGTKLVVDTIANELFDAPTAAMAIQFPHDSGRFVEPADEGENGFDRSATTSGNVVTIADDEEFDWPYRPDDDDGDPDNRPATVADWWETLDCRAMRIAVGEDNQYLNAALAAVIDDTSTADVDETMAAALRETSTYCGHFPGAAMAMEDDPDTEDVNESNILSEAAQKRVEEVGQALLGLSAPGRPSFNDAAEGDPLIMGTAQVGATLTVNTDAIEDDNDGIPEKANGDKDFQYQWLRNGDPIPGATSSSYVLTAADAGATISVRVSFIDNERYPEMRTSPSSLATSQIVGAPGEISKIVESIRGVTISAGGDVVLSVNAYGLQGVQDNKLSAGNGLEWKEGDRSFDDDDTETPWEVTYTAPSSPGNYTITASFANDGDCRPLEKDGGEEMRDKLCTATFQVRVRRDQPPVATPAPPVNPPGEIPGLIPDSDGNQYEVFTPVEGGTFDGGEGYSITVPSGAVPNGEYIGIRMSDDGAASNVGQVHQRYTLAGNMYGVHAVDASGAAISSYVLEAPAEVCVPLPASLRTNISHLSLAAINSDGTLTVLSAQVRLNGSGGDTMVCGNLSNLPASVAVGSQGAPAAPPTATPEPTPDLPDTGGTSPASGGLVWALLLGTAVVASGTFIVAGRRRKTVGSK